MIPGEDRIFFHVSSKNSAPGRDSKRFMEHLFNTFQEMKALFEADKVSINGVSAESKKSQ